jgi:hypothetical protein
MKDPTSMFRRFALKAVVWSWLIASPAYGQSATATVSGTAVDESRSPMQGIDIVVTRVDTNGERRTTTNHQGYFSVPLLRPGTYRVTARRAGFSTVEVQDVVLNVGDERALALELKIAPVRDSVVVVGSPVPSAESAGPGVLVDREFLNNLPLNGRSLHALLELTPGIVLVNGPGQFSVNGQRNNANYVAVDGVGANVGIAAMPTLGSTAGGTVPAFSALGTTTSLASVDDVEEFRVLTSAYAAEYGRTPGGQISLVTRSGGNAFRAAAFEYFRDDAMDANDWFANSRNLPKPPERQHDFGGVAGGPLAKGRTFFFASYEGLRLRQPQVGITAVPTLPARQSASPAIKPFLDAFPLPNGRDLGNALAEFSASYANPSTSNSTSIRIDHTIGPDVLIFGRYSETPSEATTRGPEGIFNALSSTSSTQIGTRTFTLATTQALHGRITHDLRFNYSRTSGSNIDALDSFGGATPPPDAAVFPAFTSHTDALVGFGIQGGPAGFAVGKNVDNLQRQINVVDNLSLVAGTHQIKAGVDYRRLAPVLDVLSYGQQAFFSDVMGALSGHASFVNITSNPVARYPLFTNLSAYVQDTWHASARLTLTTGIRWELNPPPSEASGNLPYTVNGLDNPASMTLAPKGTPLWKTTYTNFAPRVGLAYRAVEAPEHESVLHGGFGIFYDLGTGAMGSAITQSAFAYFSFKSLSGVPFPLDAAQSQPPSVNIAPPYQWTFVVADPELALPRVYEWSVSADQAFGRRQMATISYVSAAGRKLLRTETLVAPNANFSTVSVVRNSASSDYRALQLQYRRLLFGGLQALASYTLADSTDISSNESVGLPPVASIDPAVDRGPSDFDIRHAFSAAVTWNVPSIRSSGLGAAIARGWTVDAVVRARSAAPLNVVAQPPLFGVFQATRPDLVPGVPVYIVDPLAPGGWRLNRAAFATPAPGTQGTLGRNALRGFPLSQVDLSLRRRFPLQRTTVELGADAFNVLNHPNFADPDGFLGHSTFGQSQSMFGQGQQGLNALYQIGGPRSIQLSLRLTF